MDTNLSGHVLGIPREIEQILLKAQHCWLRPAEIFEILQNYKSFRICPEPADRPPGGSLFLFDKKILKYYRKDGHNWRKRKDGKTTSEGHERLQVESVDALQCYYAHGEDNENFQRRIYWMLNKALSHIVLVHYQDVKGNQTNNSRILENVEGSHTRPEAADTLGQSDMRNSVSSSMQRSPYQNQSQTTDTTSLSSMHASQFEDAESGQLMPDGHGKQQEIASDLLGQRALQVHIEGDMVGPSLSTDQLFSIIDFTPNWAYEDSEIKVLITGKFLRGQNEVEKLKLSCMFGELEVPAEVIADGVLRCIAPHHKHGRVPFYVTCSNRFACSEVREFEYRVHHVQEIDDTNARTEYEDILCMRVFKLLSLGLPSLDQDSESIGENSNLIGKINELMNDGYDEWDQMSKTTTQDIFSPKKTKDQLMQKLLKEKLRVWLLHKAAEGEKGVSLLDEDGQGVLHIAAALGYGWAIAPTVLAGVNINFRDVNGWTALHWAAFSGRERTVVSLISLGAAAGALTDPTPKYPSGRTAADLASTNGHKGIAGFLRNRP